MTSAYGADFNAAFESLRRGFAADQADIAITSVDDGVVQIDLLVKPSTCLDCILPAETIEKILKTKLSSVAPDIREVRLNDPRRDDNHK